MTQLELLALAGTGASIEISAVGRSHLELLAIANVLKGKGGKLTVRDAGRMGQLERLALASANRGNVTFVV